MFKGMNSPAWRTLIALLLVTLATSAWAKSPRLEPLDASGKRTWIVELSDPALVGFDGSNAQASGASFLKATAPTVTRAKLDFVSPNTRAYLDYLDDRFALFRRAAEASTGEPLQIKARYRNLMNGVALRLTEQQAERLSRLQGVRSVLPNEVHYPNTDAGPEWIGAGVIWNGEDGIPASQGEGIIVGVLDTGINWDHASFQDPSGIPDNYDHSNPLGEQLGLCGDPDVNCNDKIIGVYDFTDEGSLGKDVSVVGHGSNVASVAAGNRQSVFLNLGGGPQSVVLQGVAPHANIISYKICREDDPETEEDEGGCLGSDIIEGLEQALMDGVDVVNFSIGSIGSATTPWIGYARLFLDMRNAGIFAATSAGNEGPAPGSVGYPGVAPWLMGVAASTHTRFTGAVLGDFSGGSTAPPDELAGAGLPPVNGSPDGYGPAEIVWAGDFGNALCGTGESFGGFECSDHAGESNPFPPGTFNGEIVVCERGEYGRVEKSYNVMEAGAGGYVLINSLEEAESTNADDHCIPGIHLGYRDGQKLKNWLTSGSGQKVGQKPQNSPASASDHMAAIGPFGLSYTAAVADRLGDFSSRGPNQGVANVLAPDVTAPGIEILGAGRNPGGFSRLPGTSFSSPHVAGAGALLLGIDPTLTPSQMHSILATTALSEGPVDENLNPATPFGIGSGRVQVGEAAKAGLFFDITGSQFLAANPASGGDPRTLNLPSIVDDSCQGSCSFSRTVTNMAGSGSWTASADRFPEGVVVNITPDNFTLSEGASQTLNIEINPDASTIGQWVFGEIKLSSAGMPDQHLTTAIFSYGGSLPNDWTIDSNRNGGWTEIQVSGLSELPDATITSGGLAPVRNTTQTLVEDPTDSNPYDGGPGVFTVWHTITEDGMWLYARTLNSTSRDLDLYVGRDADEDGRAEESELLCSSTSPIDLEHCELLSPPAGEYWVVVQNWFGNLEDGDEATLLSAAINADDDSSLVASGPGIVAAGEPFTIRGSWSNINARPGEEWMGAIGIGTNRNDPGNVGVIPVHFNRSGIADPETFPLMNGQQHHLALAGNSSHDRMFIDIPPGVVNLDISTEGGNNSQSNALGIDLYHQDFADALDDPPLAQLPDGLDLIASLSGSSGNGPSISINGSVSPGRYFVELSNSADSAVSASIVATATSDASNLSPHKGLWDFDRRIFQGAEWNNAGDFSFTVWYAYGEDGQPTWYIASGPSVSGNIWTGDLLRVTNDGAEQQEIKVGEVSLTFLSDSEVIFTYTLYGESGFDPMHPNAPNTCPDIGGAKSYTGHWFRGIAGLGGSTLLIYSAEQAQVQYFFDAVGVPRWILAADDENQSATAETIPLLQFDGFCALCDPVTVTWSTVGEVTRTFSDENTGNWTLDFSLVPPLMQVINRTDDIEKLSDTLTCENM
jgi:subtilisin family serine protease